jgi:cyclohexyl-isocyanide hydratase
MNALLTDMQTLAFPRRKAAEGRFVSSVCTDSPMLGAAGPLRSKRAACHWSSCDILTSFGFIPRRAGRRRQCRYERRRATAGIDFALTIAAMPKGEAFAQALQAGMDYTPAPPFSAGSPTTAPRQVSDAARASSVTVLVKRRVQSREGCEGALDSELMRAKRGFDFTRLRLIGP